MSEIAGKNENNSIKMLYLIKYIIYLLQEFKLYRILSSKRTFNH